MSSYRRTDHQVHRWETGSFRIVVDESKGFSRPYALLECKSSAGMKMLTSSCMEELATRDGKALSVSGVLASCAEEPPVPDVSTD